MTTAKKKAEPEAKKDDKADQGPVTTTVVAWNGMTATDTIDGVEQAVRPATLAEQLEKHAPELVRLVVGSVPYATSAGYSLDGESITITLVSH